MDIFIQSSLVSFTCTLEVILQVSWCVQEHHEWEEWDHMLKQAFPKLPDEVHCCATASLWETHLGIRQLAYHLRDQLWFCCQRLSEARRDVTCLKSTAAVMLQQRYHSISHGG